MFELNKTLTYNAFLLLWEQLKDFLITLGDMGQVFVKVV